MFHVDHINVFSEVWNRQRARVVLALVRLWWRRPDAAGWSGIGDGAGCTSSLIIIKRQTSLALRILLYIVTFDLCVWPLEQSRPPPPSHLGNDTSLFLYFYFYFLFLCGEVSSRFDCFSFCNLKITSQGATRSTAMLPYNETRVLRNRHSNVYQRVCE